MSAERVADELAAVLGVDAVSVDPGARRLASTDHAWLSPVLSSRLPDRPADVVVTPATVEGIAQTARVAARARVAVTARGKGTGNYGQAVPLDGGIVLDCTAIDRVLEVSGGALRAEVGASFTKLEAAARATGQELAMFPSTVGSTVGGFVAGGAGGTGSIENGLLWDGFVLGARVVPCTPEALPYAVAGEAVMPHLHAYGTTGLLTEVTVKLVPARPWVALWSSFDRWTDAAAAGLQIMTSDPRPRLVSVDDAALGSVMLSDPAAPRGRVSLRAIVEESTLSGAKRVVAAAGGRVEALRPHGSSALTALSFNHVTLRAKRLRPDVCHVQVGGAPLVDAHDAVVACLPGYGLHLDGMGRPAGSDARPQLPGGGVGWGGLLVGRYHGPEHLVTAMDNLRALGVAVVDPHTWELGGHGLDGMLATAAVNDPMALLNPGKLPGRVPVAA